MKQLLHWMNKLWYIIEFVGFYLYEIVISNLRVARDVLYPSGRMKPAIIRVNVAGLSDLQLLAMANLITMTPGTLSIEIEKEGGLLLVHGLYVDDAEISARELEENFTERIRRVF